MKLLIVESPGKIKKIKSFLEQDWQVAASVGHIRDLPHKELGINIARDGVKLNYINSPDKQSTIKNLQVLASKAQEVYLAMDMDREGEAIAWHVGLILGEKNWPKIKRIAFTEITQNAVLKAIKSPRRVDANLVNAQQARRALDRLVGFKVSPILWAAKNAGTSAGRVQSVAVRLVVEREKEIRDFKPQVFFKIKALLSTDKTVQNSFMAELVSLEGKTVVSSIEEGKQNKQIIIATKKQADELIEEFKKGDWLVISQKKEKQNKNPFPPFITSTLQQAASVKLKWNAQKTMKIAQKLYENSFITYMRTDSPSISQEALKAVREFIAQNFEASYLPAKALIFKAKGGNAQEAHECIRPTNVKNIPSSVKTLGKEELDLYKLIWTQFVASQMAPAIYNTNTIEVKNGIGLFKATGRQIIFDGWTKLTGSDAEVSKEKEEGKNNKDEETPLLPEVKENSLLNLSEIKPSQHKTKPPVHYTEASLIRTLEKYGIGRPSTYASIMDNIKRRGYLREEKRKFIAEPLGEALVELLMKKFQGSWMDYRFTSHLEENLDEVAEGKRNWQELIIGFDKELKKLLV